MCTHAYNSVVLVYRLEQPPPHAVHVNHAEHADHGAAATRLARDRVGERIVAFEHERHEEKGRVSNVSKLHVQVSSARACDDTTHAK